MPVVLLCQDGDPLRGAFERVGAELCQLRPLFKQRQRFVKRRVAAFHRAHDLLKARHRLLEGHFVFTHLRYLPG